MLFTSAATRASHLVVPWLPSSCAFALLFSISKRGFILSNDDRQEVPLKPIASVAWF